jgi:hypothetical protein
MNGIFKTLPKMELQTVQCQNSIRDPYFSPYLIILAATTTIVVLASFPSEAAVEADLMYMLQPSRMYIGDNINVFRRGK